VRVRDIVLPEGVTLAGHLDPDDVVVKVAPVRAATTEETAAEAAEAEPAVAEPETPEAD
jgi:hypothetical protein